MIASTTLNNHGIYWPNIHFFDSLPVSDDDGDVRAPAAKRAKVAGNNGAVRRQQNRVAACRSRQKKKQEEAELQQNLAYYTKSNESLKKQNRELEHLLDVARIQVANMASGEGRTHRILPSTTGFVDPLFNLPLIETEPPKVGTGTSVVPFYEEGKAAIVPESICIDDVPSSNTLSEGIDGVSEFIDVLLEDKEWLGAPAAETEVAEEVTDEECDHLDILLEDDSWLNDSPAVGVISLPVTVPAPAPVVVSPVVSVSPKAPAASILVSAPAPAVVSPVVSVSPKPPVVVNPITLRAPKRRTAPAPKFQNKTSLREYHLEKNRVAARNRRLRVKMEHEQLQQSVTAYTQSNEMLKKKNRELEILLLQARNKVAANTSGEFVHYTTVFGASPPPNDFCTGDHEASVNDIATEHKCISSEIELPSNILDSVVTEAHDDDHDLSFLWN